MVASGLVIGLATGGYPAYSKEISQAALVVAMTFSLSEISFARLSPRAELRGFLLSFGMSYGILSGLLLGFAMLSSEPFIRDGWIITAAVPPAVAVIPITGLLKGDTRRALISLALLYLAALALVPGLTLLFVGRPLPVADLAVQTTLLVGVPIVLSRALRKWRRVSDVRPAAVAVSFLFLVTAIAGSTRGALFGNPGLVGSLAFLSVLRTFGLGILVLLGMRLLHTSRDVQIAATTFSSFKNLGLAVVLAFSFFEPAAALPSIVSLVLEILWLGTLPFLFPRSRVAPSGSLEEERGEG